MSRIAWKMKASILLLVILGVAAAAVSEKVLHRSKRDLAADLNDFVPIYGYGTMIVVKRYIDHDKEIQAIITSFDAAHLQSLMLKLLTVTEILQMITYLSNTGVDLQAIFGSVNNLVAAAKSTNYISPDDGSAPTGGLSGFITEIKAALPVEQLHALYLEKLKTSTDFAKMVAVLTSNEFAGYITAIQKSAAYQNIAKEIGGDVLQLFQIVKYLIGSQ